MNPRFPLQMMLPGQWLSRILGRLRPVDSARAIPASCEHCPLAACRPGTWATIVCVACHALDEQRLRTLGVFAGAKVRVVDARGGMVLDVRGTRLALGKAVARSITVRPIGA